MQELRDLAANEDIVFVRIKENDDMLKCEAFSNKGYIGDCLLRNEIVVEKLKQRAVLNKVKGDDLKEIIRDVARLHLKMKSGWFEKS